jgi:glycosyltransferase involved in cell wall biosynthesis
MSAPLVSVVIATRNRPHLLRLALASITAQQGLPGQGVEAVVVNDGGTDLTSELAGAAGAGLRVRSLVLPSRRGLPAARNAGIDAARGEFLAFLDDDDLYLPGHLRAAIDVLGSGEADAAYTTCLISPVRVDPARPLPAFPASMGYPFDPGLLSVANLLAVHSVVLRRPASARFDQGLDALEDWDFWLRLSRNYGYRFVHSAEPTVIYHRIAGQPSMCGSTVIDAAALNRFGVLVQRLWRRWPSPSARAARFRAYLGVMYWHAFSLLASGQALDDLYFQHCLRILADAWTGSQAEDDIIDRIRHAVQGDPVAAHAA